jgi:hypothetical protein
LTVYGESQPEGMKIELQYTKIAAGGGEEGGGEEGNAERRALEGEGDV